MSSCSAAATSPSTTPTPLAPSPPKLWSCSSRKCARTPGDVGVLRSQKVAVKVISGDNAVSVGAVAGSLGLEGGDRPIDARELPSDQEKLADTLDGATTFGRVRPDQKREMVAALQSRGHTVAMTGDGVNDVLALKDADIGVSMGSGSPATRAVAQIVLLDNKFATLPYVVAEGRRVIGNIERVSNLFLTKTVYSVVLAFLIGITGVLSQVFDFEPLPYPFLPRHVTIAAWFTIGIPGLHLVSGTQQRARANRFRLARDASGVAVGPDHRHHHVHLLRIGLPRPGPDGNPEDPGRNQCAHHVDHDRRVGSGRRGSAVRLVEARSDRRVGSRIPHPVALPFTREFFKLDPSNVAATTLAITLGAIGVCTRGTLVVDQRTPARGETKDVRDADDCRRASPCPQ